MEALTKAKDCYIRLHHYQSCHSEEHVLQLKSDVDRFLSIAIKEITPTKLFSTPDFLEILRSALESHAAREDGDIVPVTKAFANLEIYFLQLVEQPWKPEFKKIKLYGGFFKTKIKSVLPACETIFLRAGYSISSDQRTMIHKGPIKEMPLFALAFDCKVGQSQCIAILEHYKKVRGMSVSLSSAVEGFMGQRMQARPLSDALKSNTVMKNVFASVNSNQSNAGLAMMPPAVPRRDPIQNATNGNIPQQSDMRMQQNLDPFGFIPPDQTPQSYALMEPTPVSPLAVGAMFPSKPSQNSKFVFTPEAAIMQLNSVEDFIPEEPRGFQSDHMEESLKLVHEQNMFKQFPPPTHEASFRANPPRSGEWNPIQMLQPALISAPGNLKQIDDPMNTVSALNAMSARSAATYPPGIVQPRTYAMAPSSFVDEGIDVSHSSKGTIPSRPYQLPEHNTVLSPNRPTSSTYQPPSDYGSLNISSAGMKSQQTSALNYNQSNYNIQTDSNDSSMYQSKDLSTVATRLDGNLNGVSAPPPIPPRSCKPVYDGNGRDVVDMSAPLQVTLPRPQTADVASRVSPTTGLQSLSNLPRAPVPGFSTRRDRLVTSGKSSSLKYPETKVSMLQQAAQTRAARSMDMSLLAWECKLCTTKNEASQSVCNVCSHSRLGPDTSHPALGLSKKSCPRCTLENDADRTACEACGETLTDTFTFV